MSGCNPDTIIRNYGHRHSLACDHDPFMTHDGRVIYLEEDEFHEHCDKGHTHKAKLHLTDTFNRIARSEEEAADIKENYVFIRKDGNAELRTPAPITKQNKNGYNVVGMLMRL